MWHDEKHKVMCGKSSDCEHFMLLFEIFSSSECERVRQMKWQKETKERNERYPGENVVHINKAKCRSMCVMLCTYSVHKLQDCTLYIVGFISLFAYIYFLGFFHLRLPFVLPVIRWLCFSLLCSSTHILHSLLYFSYISHDKHWTFVSFTSNLFLIHHTSDQL